MRGAWLIPAALFACGGKTPDAPRVDATVASGPVASAAAARLRDVSLPRPACAVADGAPRPWPRAREVARVVRGESGAAAAGHGAHLAQAFVGDAADRPRPLRFLGTHSFDLLDKLVHEGGSDEDRRRMACAALEAAASTGAPVVRLWGSLKRTGDGAEVDAARRALELVVDENARRERPLRLIVVLLNHQAGYGAPRPEASLDDQDAASGWSARAVYLQGGWRGSGRGQLEERIRALSASETLRTSPYVLAWELVNELDTHRAVAGGTFLGPEADALRDRFLVPALELLAQSVSQPVAFGELRGALGPAYLGFARNLVGALSPSVRARLVWTSHVYAAARGDIDRATAKLDVDLELGAELGLPFVLGELGQRAPGAAPGFCRDGPPHDLPALFRGVLAHGSKAPRRAAIDAAVFWGEGHCRLEVRHPDRSETSSVGVGGDTADLGPGEHQAREFLRKQRGEPRFSTE